MSGLSPSPRRRSLRLRLANIEQKIIRLQEEIYQAEQREPYGSPGLFGDPQPTLTALKQYLEHLEKVAKEIRRRLGGDRPDHV